MKHKQVATVLAACAGCACSVLAQDMTRNYNPYALSGGTVPLGPFPLAGGPGVMHGSQGFASGLIRSRTQATSAAAAVRDDTVNLNLTQDLTLGGGPNMVNIYTIIEARGLIQTPAPGLTDFNATVNLRNPGGGAVQRSATVTPALVAAPPAGSFSRNLGGGEFYYWNFDTWAGQLGANATRQFDLELTSSIRARTTADAAGPRVNNVDFDTTQNANTITQTQRGFKATVVASPQGLASSRGAIGADATRAAGNAIARKTLINGNTNTGDGVRLGIVELGRPSTQHTSMAGMNLDAASMAENWSDEHSLAVASDMAGHGGTAEQRGVAYGSTLSASSFLAQAGANETQQIQSSLAYLVHNQDAKVINGSFGSFSFTDPYNPAVSDGDNGVARVLDWTVDNTNRTVVMAAGNNGNTGAPIPGGRGYGPGNPNPIAGFDRPQSIGGGSGGYNVITVGALDYDFTARAFYSSFGPTRSPLDRSKPDIVAPGTFILSAVDADLNRDGIFNDYERVFFGSEDLNLPNNRQTMGSSITGTSFAAPLVSGAAGVMTEYGNKLIERAGATNPDRRDPRVIKAAMMNTANRDVRHRDGTAWNQGVSGDTIVRPLDQELGSGMLNLPQALNATYEYEARADNDIPATVTRPNYFIKTISSAWDVQTVAPQGASGSRVDYWQANALVKGSRVRATVTWNAHVTENNGAGGTVGRIDTNDTYNAATLNNLDLYLYTAVPLAEQRNGAPEYQFHTASASTVDNVELISDYRIQNNRSVLFEVQNNSANNETYAITWQNLDNAAATAKRLPPGFTGRGVVDPVDSYEPSRYEEKYHVNFTPRFDAGKIIRGQEQITICDNNADVVYDPAQSYHIFLGPELRQFSSVADSELSWYDPANPISLTNLLTSSDPRGHWDLLNSALTDSEGMLAPTDLTPANAPDFYNELASLGQNDVGEFNFAIDVNGDGMFTPGVDAAGWFEVIPAPSSVVLLGLAGLVAGRRRRTQA